MFLDFVPPECLIAAPQTTVFCEGFARAVIIHFEDCSDNDATDRELIQREKSFPMVVISFIFIILDLGSGNSGCNVGVGSGRAGQKVTPFLTDSICE